MIGQRLAPGEQLAVGGSLLTLVGAALPWVHGGGEMVLGIDTDGFLTLMLAVSVVGVVALWEWGGAQQAVVALFGALIASLAAVALVDLGTLQDASDGTVRAGVGPYVVFVAGVLVVGAGLSGLVRKRRGRSDSADG